MERTERFCLRSDSTKSEWTKGFMSPAKLMSHYGPKPPVVTRTRPVSPCISVQTLTSTEDEGQEDLAFADSIMQRFGIGKSWLLEVETPEFERLPGISEKEVQVLMEYRDRFLYEKHEEDISHLIDDFQYFKKN